LREHSYCAVRLSIEQLVQSIAGKAMTLSSFTFVLFAAFSSIRIFSYVPQIRKVAADMHGATAISFSTWGLWAAANVATAAYALVNLGDTYLAAVSALYAACCLTVIGLTAAKRRGVARRVFNESAAHAAASDRVAHAERSELVASLKSAAEAEAAALLSGGSRNPQFEREVATHARRIAYHDFMRYLRSRLKALGGDEGAGAYARVDDGRPRTSRPARS
jgi:hypothetical protein